MGNDDVVKKGIRVDVAGPPKKYGQPLYNDTIVAVVLIGVWSFACGMLGSMVFYALAGGGYGT